MRLNWKEQLDACPELRKISNWPNIIAADLPKDKRRGFIRNLRAITLVLSGEKVKDAALMVNLSSSRVSQILARSLASEQNKPPALTKSLIPDYRITNGVRKKTLSTIEKESGSRGAFMYLIDNLEGLKSGLDKVITAHQGRKNYSQNLTPNSFHSEYLRLLVDLGWETHKYPFNQIKQGAESCRKYFHSRSERLINKKQKPKRKYIKKIVPIKPYQEVQIDSQVIDVNTSIFLDFNGQSVLTRISRLSLFMAIDVASDCILAYHLCLTKDPNQADLLTLLEKIHLPWEPYDLKTPGLSYDVGACLPSGLGNQFTNAGIGVFKLDNALCHIAHTVRNHICETLESTLNFGLPAQPKGRNFIEYAFRRLNRHTHRFASTTGSHPKDPIKESKANSAKAPLLTLSALEEVLSVVITSYNVTPQERLAGLFPLEVIKNEMSRQFCRISFSRVDRKPRAFLKRQSATVKCIKHENRRPHINFLGLRYSGDCLLDSVLTDKKVILEYDIRDVRRLIVLTQHAELLGEVYAPRTWQAYPFSVQTKKKISKEVNHSRLKMKDPLTEYFALLLKSKHLPKNSTEIVRIHKEILRDQSVFKTDAHQLHVALKSKHNKSTRVLKWSHKNIMKNNNAKFTPRNNI